MNIEAVEVEQCKYNIKYETGREEISSKKDDIVAHFRNQKIPGFRQGKATDDVVRLHFAKEINEQLKKSLAYDAVMNSMTEKKLQPIGEPSFTSVELENNKFSCEFTIFTLPSFELQDYKNFEITKAHGLKTVDALAAEMVEELRNKFGETVPFTDKDFVQNKDSIILNYEGSIDGKVIDALKVDGELMTVGKAGFFDDNLLGMKTGETREFDITIPADSGSEFAGKIVHFKTELVMGSKTSPMPIDDELAKKIGLNTVDELMNNVNMTASLRVKELEDQFYYDQIGKKLVDINKFTIPSWIIGEQLKSHAQQSNINFETMSDKEKSEYADIIEKNIKLTLILSKVRDNEPDAQLTDEEAIKLIKDKMSKVTDNPDTVLNNLAQNNQLAFLIARVRDEYVFDFIKNNSKILE